MNIPIIYSAKRGGVVTNVCNCIDANYFKGVGSNQERTGVIVADDMNTPIIIHKDIGPGSSSNLGIELLGNEVASCLCARDYKGISRMGANAVIVDGFNKDADGESVRGLKAQYQKNSASNFCRDGSYGASAVIAIDEQNKCVRKDDTVGTIMTDGNSPKHNNRIGEIADNNSIRIRKLTPCECFMLQGWKKEEFMRAKNAGVSDSQLYKQAGNGVSVNITEVIGRALREIELEEQGE